MKQHKGSTHGRTIWRMSEAVPLGEFVAVTDVGATKAKAAKPAATSRPGPAAPATFATAAAPAAPTTPAAPRQAEVSHGSWLESSFELLSGTEISEGPDTVPDDLFDELFAATTSPEPRVPSKTRNDE